MSDFVTDTHRLVVKLFTSEYEMYFIVQDRLMYVEGRNIASHAFDRCIFRMRDWVRCFVTDAISCLPD